MFSIERWQEIFDTIRKNKLRTFLTGLSVASGIFILVILLGFGQGLANGIEKEFSRNASNTIWIWSNVTSKEYKGLNPGRRIRFENKNFQDILEVHIDDLEYKSPIKALWQTQISRKNESGTYSLEGVYPDFQFIQNANLLQGRFLNFSDHENFEKVVAIGIKVKEELFKNEDPLNKQLQINGINFKVIGVFSDPGGEFEEARAYIPLSTSQRVFGGNNNFNTFSFTLKPQKTFDASVEASKNFKSEVEKYLKETHIIASDDTRALGSSNTLEDVKRFHTLTNNIKLFFWFVGICTIIAGIVGVSNIMLIIVKERTKEIGIRKAIGAEPWSIIGMILHEAIFVTAFAGFAGLIFSMGLLEILGPNVEIDYIVNPSVNFNVAISTVFLLIIAGTLAGFFPAYKAAKIKPIVALREE